MLIIRTKIRGKEYDKNILDIVKKAQKKGKETIDIALARKIFELLYYSYGDYPDISKDTVKYLRRNFLWDKQADLWFRERIRQWAANKGKR